jgi:hypothetical protein
MIASAIISGVMGEFIWGRRKFHARFFLCIFSVNEDALRNNWLVTHEMSASAEERIGKWIRICSECIHSFGLCVYALSAFGLFCLRCGAD